MTNWGYIDSTNADLMTPGEDAGHGRCKAEQFGFAVEDVVVYGSLSGLRAWLESALAQLPPDRHGDVVAVDLDKQWEWINTSAPLYEDDTPDPDNDFPWQPDTDTVHDLFEAVIADPAAAGWTLSDDIVRLNVSLTDDTGDLMPGFTLNPAETDVDREVGIGIGLRYC